MFSRCVVGINISLEGPSWIGASVALTNVVTNKVIYCRDLGIEIGEDEWDFVVPYQKPLLPTEENWKDTM